MWLWICWCHQLELQIEPCFQFMAPLWALKEPRSNRATWCVQWISLSAMNDLSSVMLQHRVLSLNGKEISRDQTETLDQILQVMRIYIHGGITSLCALLSPGRRVRGSASELKHHLGLFHWFQEILDHHGMKIVSSSCLMEITSPFIFIHALSSFLPYFSSPGRGCQDAGKERSGHFSLL